MSKITIVGPEEKVAIVRDALGRCTFPYEAKLKRPVTIRFGETGKRSDGGVAWAYAFSGRREILLGLNLTPQQTRYVTIHELGHFIDHDCMNKAKRQEIIKLMRPQPLGWNDGKTGKRPNQSVYQCLPSEAFADTCVRAFSDIRGVLTGWYGRQVLRPDLEKFREVVLRDDPYVPGGAPDPEGPPVDVVEEPDDEPKLDVDALLAQIALLTADRDDLAAQKVALEAEVVALKADGEIVSAQATLAEKALDMAEAEVLSLKALADQRRALIRTLRGRISYLERQIAAANNRRPTMMQRVREALRRQ
jgi:hypothetical protein